MKKGLLHFAGILFILLVSCNSSPAQKKQNWTKDQLLPPAELAATLKSEKNIPVIICVGPGASIPHSIDIGMTNDAENIEKFKEVLSKLPKDTSIVFYCGCCPYERCPNVRPAIYILNSMKFTNFHMLDLPTNIKVDWINKGYPVVE